MIVEIEIIVFMKNDIVIMEGLRKSLKIYEEKGEADEFLEKIINNIDKLEKCEEFCMLRKITDDKSNVIRCICVGNDDFYDYIYKDKFINEWIKYFKNVFYLKVNYKTKDISINLHKEKDYYKITNKEIIDILDNIDK